MTQLSSSIRVARAALKYPPTWQNRTHQTLHRRDAIVSKMAQHRPAVSTRAITSTAASSSFGETVGRNSLSANIPLNDKYHMHWRPPFSWTMQNMMMSTSTTLLNPNDTGNTLPEDQNVTIAPEKEEQGEMEGGVSVPFQRSKKAKSKGAFSGFDDRANAKLTALSKAKKEAEDAQASYLWLTTADDVDTNFDAEDLHEEWNLSEQKLAIAYSQAIKYTSRLTNNQEATETAERLLFEWMNRFLDPFGVLLADPTMDPNTMYLNRKRMVRTINKVASKLTPSEISSESKPAPSTLKGEDGASSTLPKIRISPPTSKDYINLLRAYSMSKAYRKGQQCEVLMRNMMQLAKTVAYYYDEDDETWTEARAYDVGMESVVGGEVNEMKKWRSWVNESVPNSKVFALAIKCHAGSTHNESLERIILLNHVHDTFSSCCESHIPGMYKDDPYVLFHSIKALKNLQKKEEKEKGHEWLTKLHKFVTSPENADYFQEREIDGELKNQSKELNQTDATSSPEASAVYAQTINVTSAYTTFIRLIARLRGTDGVAADALQVLNRMHRVHNVFVNGLGNPETQTPPTDETSKNEDTETLVNPKRIAHIDIHANAYNLVLGLYRDSKKGEDAPKAIELLQRMIDAGNEEQENRRGVPLPTEQSFEFTIMSLANMPDGKKGIEEAERLIELMQEKDDLESPVAVYNAFITVCNRKLFGKAQLYDKALNILDKMNEMSKKNPGATPNPETLALVMKSCSLSAHEDHEAVLATASKLFSQLVKQESSEKSAVALTDRAYYYMMKCVDTHMVEDPVAKKDRIEELFSEACERGLCSANVLTMFKNSVSEEDYHLTVGKGRLADHWIANITGPRALYTDGSKGGAGKNARRKGKSTSDWVKKGKVKESERVTKKKDKKAKKFFKKMKTA